MFHTKPKWVLSTRHPLQYPISRTRNYDKYQMAKEDTDRVQRKVDKIMQDARPGELSSPFRHPKGRESQRGLARPSKSFVWGCQGFPKASLKPGARALGGGWAAGTPYSSTGSDQVRAVRGKPYMLLNFFGIEVKFKFPWQLSYNL